MHILICPNAFKNSLSAREAANAIQHGLSKSNLEFTSECFPIADGGDGTAALITELSGGKFIETTVHDPLGRRIKAQYGLIHKGTTAVIDMASASGLKLHDPSELNPMQASSIGTGELITDALDKGIRKILIGMGGTATVDGGCGILESLGVKFFNAQNQVIKPVPENLLTLSRIDTTNLDSRIKDCECILICDVTNYLLGRKGAARIFGPQKGASKKTVLMLEKAMSQFNLVAQKTTSINLNKLPGGGAAGGAAAGVTTFLNAKSVKGANYFLSLTNFDRALEKADVVITGEGSIDLQTLSGKGPYAVAIKAYNSKIPVIALAGKVPITNNVKIQKYFPVLLSIGNEPTDYTTAIQNTKINLERISLQIGNFLHQGSSKKLTLIRNASR